MASGVGPVAKDGASYAHSAAVAWEQADSRTGPDSAASTPERLVGASRSALRSSLKRAPAHESGEAAGVAAAGAHPAAVGDDGGAASQVFFLACYV